MKQYAAKTKNDYKFISNSALELLTKLRHGHKVSNLVHVKQLTFEEYVARFELVTMIINPITSINFPVESEVCGTSEPKTSTK